MVHVTEDKLVVFEFCDGLKQFLLNAPFEVFEFGLEIVYCEGTSAAKVKETRKKLWQKGYSIVEEKETVRIETI